MFAVQMKEALFQKLPKAGLIFHVYAVKHMSSTGCTAVQPSFSSAMACVVSLAGMARLSGGSGPHKQPLSLKSSAAESLFAARQR